MWVFVLVEKRLNSTSGRVVQLPRRELNREVAGLASTHDVHNPGCSTVMFSN